jgi:RNA polymerase sigma-70 factor (ECF subfamily)
MVRLRARHPEALGLLYDRYGKAAYSLALRSLGDAALAESVLAEAMLKCWNRIATFKGTRGSALGIWLLVTTHENALNHLRIAGRKSAELATEAGVLDGGAIFQDWSNRVDGERVEETFRLLRRLDADEKDVLEMAFFEGLSAAEISGRMGRTAAEVDKLIDSAFAKLAYVEQEH